MASVPIVSIVKVDKKNKSVNNTLERYCMEACQEVVSRLTWITDRAAVECAWGEETKLLRNHYRR